MPNNDPTAATAPSANIEARVAQVKDTMHEVRERLGDAKDVAVDRAGTMTDTARRVIKERPLLAVGVAFGLGYALMRLLRR